MAIFLSRILFSTLFCAWSLISIDNLFAHAQSTGFCWEHDYNDYGEKICKNFQTIGELQQRHIRLRKGCQSADICSVVQYIKYQNRFFYHGIKVCSNSNSGDSAIMIATDTDEQGGFYASMIQRNDSSCAENYLNFVNFFRDDQTYLYIERGNLKFGGQMLE